MISSPTRLETGCEVDPGEDDALSSPVEQIAVHYIDEQLEKARRSLRRTRVFCILTVLLILGYMSFVTVAIRNRLLRPDAAAEMAVYYFNRFAAQNGQAPLASIGDQPRGPVVPASVSVATETVESPQHPFTGVNAPANGDPIQVEAEVADYVRGFISQPHGNLQDLIREARHPKTVQQLSDELDQEMRERLPSHFSYGLADPDYMSYVDEKLATLEQLESQFDRLAHADDLTPYEKTLRHILASTMGSAHEGS